MKGSQAHRHGRSSLPRLLSEEKGPRLHDLGLVLAQEPGVHHEGLEAVADRLAATLDARRARTRRARGPGATGVWGKNTPPEEKLRGKLP